MIKFMTVEACYGSSESGPGTFGPACIYGASPRLIQNCQTSTVHMEVLGLGVGEGLAMIKVHLVWSGTCAWSVMGTYQTYNYYYDSNH
jgi:hypothetical protein